MNIDISNISGTNCFLDSNSVTQIEEIIEKCELGHVHTLGSGNYHYLTYFFLKRIPTKFDLLIFDNHPDMQLPAFGDELSCGSWAKIAAESVENLENIFLLGAAEHHIKEEQPLPEKVQIISDTMDIFSANPLYITIDKDVLSAEYAVTDWDQGNMSLDELIEHLNSLQSRDIIGIDICGNSKKDIITPNKVNQKVDTILLEICNSLLNR